MENAEDRSTSNELNNNLRELIAELCGQKQELTSLREEVRGKSLAVETEVKRIKSGQDIKWRYEGNKVQFEFNSSLEDNLKQTIWGLGNGKSEYSIELLKELCEKLRVRNKHIRIADSSEGGWETVRQYESNPLASDSDDESKINRAESRALKRKKKQCKGRHLKVKPSATFSYNDIYGGKRNEGSTPNPITGQPAQPRQGSFRPFTATYGRGVIGPCFACGEFNHIRRTCPHIKAAEQPDYPGKK